MDALRKSMAQAPEAKETVAKEIVPPKKAPQRATAQRRKKAG
jgi:hypothetical protein